MPLSDSEVSDLMLQWVAKELPSTYVEKSWDPETGTGAIISKGLWYACRGVIFDANGVIMVEKISEHATLEGARAKGENWWQQALEKMEKFEHGSVIDCSRVVYSHHGIYDEESNSVIEYYGTSDKLPKAKVCATPLKKFLLRESSYKLRLSLFKPPKGTEVYEPEKTVRIARELIGTADYNALGNNCQHLASFCTTGKAQSFDVNLLKKAMGIVSATGLSGLALFASFCGVIYLIAPTVFLAQALIGFVLTPLGLSILIIIAGTSVIGAGIAIACMVVLTQFKKKNILSTPSNPTSEEFQQFISLLSDMPDIC